MDEKLRKIFTGKFTKSAKQIKNLDDIKIPFVYKDAILYSPGIWNEITFTKEAIQTSFENQVWDKKNTSLFLDHKDSTHDWIGDVQNIRLGDEGKLIGDLYIVSKEQAQKVAYGAEWGISPTIQILNKNKEGVMTLFDNINFSLVITPAMDTNYINENKQYSKEENKMDLDSIKRETEAELAKMNAAAPSTVTGASELSFADNTPTQKDGASAEKDVAFKKQSLMPPGPGSPTPEQPGVSTKMPGAPCIDDAAGTNSKILPFEENQILSKSKLETIGIKLHNLSEKKEALAFKAEIEALVKEILDVADMTVAFNKKQEELNNTIKQMEQMAAMFSEKSELIKEKDRIVATYQSKIVELNGRVAMYQERDTLKEQEKKIAKFSKVLNNYCKFHGYFSATQIDEAKARLATLSDEALEMIGRDVAVGLSESEDVVLPRNSAQLSQVTIAPVVEQPTDASPKDKMSTLFEKYSRAQE